MNSTEQKEFGAMLKEVYTDVLIVILAFAGIVAGTFFSSKISWQREIERKELKAAAKIKEQAAQIDVWALVNQDRQFSTDRVGDAIEVRKAAKLEPGIEYPVGTLRAFDTTYPPPFNCIKEDPDDAPMYADPIITVRADGIVQIRSSLGNKVGWMICGPTAKGTKTGEYLYYPEETDSQDSFEGWGRGMTSVRVPLNGKNNLAVSIGHPDIESDMQAHNYYYDQTLGEVYKDTPAEYASRSRRVWVSHLIVSAYDFDPRDPGAKSRTPSVTVKIRLRYYSAWDLTQEEYDAVKFSETGVTEKNYSPYSTVELVIG